MIKKITNYAWQARYQFAKYFIVGISGVVIDMITLIFFKERLGFLPVFAVLSNQAIVLIYNFLLNKYWSFKNTEMPKKQLVRYLSLAAFNYVFSVITMLIFSDILNFDYRLVRISTIILAVSWNFLLYKHWVYKKEGLVGREG